MEEQRKIIHIDMDAFYASVEQRDFPELRGIPIAVGGTGERGVIATASYEARQYGIHSAMPTHLALRKLKILKIVPPRFHVYKEVSAQIRQIFQRYTDKIEPLSLDEAYLDVTYTENPLPSATLIAREIKKEIKEALHLVASAGVSYNKFLAKTASDRDKPDGIFIILPKDGPTFVQNMPVKDFFGVGKVMAKKLATHNIYYGRDLLPYSKWELQHLFGKYGVFLYDISRGIDHREVETKRTRKSVGVENTFRKNIENSAMLNDAFTTIFETFWERYKATHKKAKTLTIKIRNKDFETHTRSQTIGSYVVNKLETKQVLESLLLSALNENYSIRLLGISSSNFDQEELKPTQQLTLW